jgi:p-cumate 2,3-dioxygenase subunit beta
MIAESLHREVEDFLYAEAELLDDWRLEEWADLFTADCRYLVPSADLPAGASPHQNLFYIADDHTLLRERVKRLGKRNAHAEYPHSRTRHLVSNIRIDPASHTNEIVLRCAFLVHRYRAEATDQFIGTSRYKIIRVDGALRIQEKFCRLDVDNLRAQGRISILL